MTGGTGEGGVTWGPAQVTLTATYDPGTNTIFWSAVGQGSPGEDDTQLGYQITSSIGITYDGSNADIVIDARSFGGSGSESHSGTYTPDSSIVTLHPGAQIYLYLVGSDNSGGHVQTQGDVFIPIHPQFWVNIPLPANNGTNTITFIATQDGNEVGMWQQQAGDGARTVRVGPLSTQDVVTVSQLTPGSTIQNGPDGNPILTGTTQLSTLGTATPGAGSSSGGGTTASLGAPANPSTPAAPTSPGKPPASAGVQAPVTPPAAPTLTPPAGGDGSASSTDIALLDNDIATLLNQGTAAAATNANNITAALNLLNNQTVANSTAEIKAINQNIAAVDQVSTALTDYTGVDQTLPTTYNTTPVVNPGSYSPSATAAAVLPVAPTLPTTVASSHVITLHVKFPKLDGSTLLDWSTDIDFSSDPYATPIAVFRACMLAIATLTFYLACFWAVRGAFTSK